MKKTIITFLSVLLLISGNLLAQGNKSIDAGVKAYEKGDYPAAIAALDTGLEDPTSLKDKSLARGYYYRGQAKIIYLNKLKTKENLPEEMANTIRDHGLTIYADLKRAKNHDTAEKLSAEIKNAIKRAEKLLLEMAKTALKESREYGLDADAKKVRFEAVIVLGDACTEINKRNYVPYNLKAHSYLGLLDSIPALKNFHLADDVFFRSAPRGGDLTIAYTYIAIAELERDLNNNMKVAREAIKEGKERLEGENKKIQGLSDRPPAAKAALDLLYMDIKSDIEKAGVAMGVEK